jgi:regulator of sigma E protease
MHEFLISAVAFIVLVGVMVVVHEFGHFAVAKLCGVRVEAFSFGFGPRLFGVKYGDTDYKVCLLPLGGFVKMTGEAPEQNLEAPGAETPSLEDDPGSFTAHPRWQRMLIGVAGPAANFVLALVLMVFYYGWINEVPTYQGLPTTSEWVIPDSPAAQAGIQPGDIIRHFDNEANPGWEQVGIRSTMNLGQTLPVTVERKGRQIALSLHIPREAKGEEFDFIKLGLLPQLQAGPIAVEEVEPGTPAAQAGLRGGDRITAVDGFAFHSIQTLLPYLRVGQGKPVTLTVLRDGTASLDLVVHPAKLESEQDGYPWRLGFKPVQMGVGIAKPLPLFAAAGKSLEFTRKNSFLIVDVLGRLFTHKVAVSQLAGPVGIARMAGEAAEMEGWNPKFSLAAAISLNLGILNLLPFPILDGGGIFLLLIESTIRRDIGIDVKERIYQAAFVVLVAFFAFVIFNDVTKLPIFTHLKP